MDESVIASMRRLVGAGSDVVAFPAGPVGAGVSLEQAMRERAIARAKRERIMGDLLVKVNNYLIFTILGHSRI